jgi:hypothetical protein
MSKFRAMVIIVKCEHCGEETAKLVAIGNIGRILAANTEEVWGDVCGVI